MTFFIIYTTAIVLCWSIGTTTSAQLGKAQPTPPTLLTSPATVNVTVGTEVVVICSEPGGTVQWYGPDGGVVPSSGDVRQAGPSSARQLVFTSYQSSQGGQYQCRTSKDGTNSTLYVTLGTKVEGVTVTRTVQGSSPALRVSWTAINGSGITYTVCYSTTSGAQSDPPSGANCGASGITGTSTTLSPLSIGTTYYIWVAAVSSGGRGAYSDKQQARTYNVPLKVSPRPTLTKAARSGRPALTVTWTAPQSDRPITKYQVHYRRSGTTSWSTKEVTSRSTTLENLPAGTIYQVRMRAVSDVGVGPYSDVGAIITYRVPSKVGHLTLTKAARSGRPALTLTWTAPQSDRPITKYQVQYRSSGATSWSAKDVTSRSTTLENLPAGTGYQAQVRAVSDVGTGPYSDVRTITTYRVPSRVSGVTVTKAVRSGRPALIVRWTRHNVNERVTGYQVQYRRGTSGEWREKRVSSVSTSTYLENLDIGTSYQVRVNALSDIANGPVGDIRVQTTYNDPPPPSGVRVTPLPQHGVLRVTWRAPTVDTGLTITGYSVQYRTSSTGPYSRARTVSGTSTSTTISGLQLGTRYRVRVAAVTQLGTGVYSNDVTGTTFNSPSPPSIISITSSTTTLTIRWDNGRYNYSLHVQRKGSTEIRFFGLVTPPYNITGLESNTEYTVSIAAYSSAGNIKANRSKVAYTVPEVPRDLVLQVLSSTSIRVTWTPPPNAERLPLTYHVGYSSEFTAKISTSTTELSLVLTDLHPFDEYTVTVEVENLAGNSVSLYKSVRTWRTVPTAPPSAPRVNRIYPRSILLQWEPPPRSGRNGIITQYIVQINKPSDRKQLNKTVDLKNPTFSDSTTITFNATGLTPYTTYMWRIAAVNHVGVGPYSTLTNVETAEDIPGPVKALSHQVLSNTSVRIMWNSPNEPNGVITGYDVVYGVYEEDNSTTVNVERELTLTINNLTPKVPFEVSVSARTVAGTGKKQSKVLFTIEGAPSVKVQNVVTKWINDNSAVHVSWIPLTLHEARGFPLYVVTYWPSSLNRVSRDINSVTTTDSSVVIGGLDPTTSYSITVDVYTGNGTIKGSVTTERNTLNPPVKPGIDNTGVIAGSSVSLLLVVIILIMVITITTVVYCKRKHKIRENVETKEDNAKNECVQLEDNPAYGEVNIYEEIQ